MTASIRASTDRVREIVREAFMRGADYGEGWMSLPEGAEVDADDYAENVVAGLEATEGETSRISAKERYIKLIVEMLLRRTGSVEGLSNEDEAGFVDELDRCWWTMSRSTQNEMECAIALISEAMRKSGFDGSRGNPHGEDSQLADEGIAMIADRDIEDAILDAFAAGARALTAAQLAGILPRIRGDAPSVEEVRAAAERLARRHRIGASSDGGPTRYARLDAARAAPTAPIDAGAHPPRDYAVYSMRFEPPSSPIGGWHIYRQDPVDRGVYHVLGQGLGEDEARTVVRALNDMAERDSVRERRTRSWIAPGKDLSAYEKPEKTTHK